jgi:hypothetical protein
LENGSYKSEDLPSSRYNPLNQIVVKGTAVKFSRHSFPSVLLIFIYLYITEPHYAKD